MTYDCKRCGHDWDDHNDYELEKGCRCLSCYVITPTKCKVGLDPEDNEGPPCQCEGFIREENQK